MRKRSVAFLAFAMLMLSSLAQAEESNVHVVGQGETFSQIASRFISEHVYRKNGSLKTLRELNPQIADIEKIYPGQKIVLGEEDPRVPASAPVPVLAPLPINNGKEASSPPLQEEEVGVSTAVEPAQETASRLGAEAGFAYFRLDDTDKSTGASATLLSNLSPQLRFRWYLDWGPEWSSRIGFRYQSFKIQDATSETPRSIQGANGALYSFEAGATRNWSETSRTGLGLAFGDQLFLHAPTPFAVSVDKVGTPSIQASHEQGIFRVRNASFGARVSGEVLLPGRGDGYSTQAGYGGEAALYLKHDFHSLSLRGEVYYGISQQNSSVITQKESQLGGLFGLTWRLGD